MAKNKQPKTDQMKVSTLNADGSVREERPKPPNMLGTITKIHNQAVSVARQWQQQHPNFVANGVDSSLFNRQVADLANLMQQDQTHSVQKLANSRLMNDCKVKAKNGLNILKSYFQEELLVGNLIDIDKIFEDCGFTKRTSPKEVNYYSFPYSQETQIDCLEKTVLHLQQTTNSYASKTFGIRFWQQLATDFKQAVLNSENLRVEKSNLSHQKKIQSSQIKNLLITLKLQVRASFYKNNAEQILRTFGFLKENF